MKSSVHAQDIAHKVIVEEALIEVEMLRWHRGESLVGCWPHGAQAVACQGFLAAIVKEHVSIFSRQAEVGQKHVLVVASQEDEFEGRSIFLQFQQVGDDPLGGRPAIDIIPQKTQTIPDFEREPFDQVTQFVKTAVNIADHVTTHDVPYPKPAAPRAQYLS